MLVHPPNENAHQLRAWMPAPHKLTFHSVCTEAEVAGRWALPAVRRLHARVRVLLFLAEEIHAAVAWRPAASTAARHQSSRALRRCSGHEPAAASSWRPNRDE